MKWKIPIIGLLSLSALTACQADQQATDNDAGYEGVENTRFERMADDMTDTNKGNNRSDTDLDRTNAGDNNYQLADKAADKIEQDVKSVEGASVLKTDNNAYVAAEIDNQGGDENVSDQVEQQIIKIVKSVDQDIDHV